MSVISYTWVKQALQGAGLVPRGGSEVRTEGDDRGGRCRETSCGSKTIVTAGGRAAPGTWSMYFRSRPTYCLSGNSTFAATNNLTSTLPDPGNNSYCTGAAAPRT